MPERACHSRAAGFTLIEMMVALAIFSIAAMALIRLEGATIRSTGILDDTVVANIVARNLAVESITDGISPTLGTTTGTETNGGRSWTWTRQARSLGDAGAMLISISVADQNGRTIGRTTVVRPPAS